MNLKNKVILVTGSSRGIGAAIAKLLAKEGAKVVVHYHVGKKEADRVVKEIKEEGGEALLTQTDVRDITDVKRIRDGILTLVELNEYSQKIPPAEHQKFVTGLYKLILSQRNMQRDDITFLLRS